MVILYTNLCKRNLSNRTYIRVFFAVKFGVTRFDSDSACSILSKAAAANLAFVGTSYMSPSLADSAQYTGPTLLAKMVEIAPVVRK